MRCSLAALASEGFPQSAHSAGRHNLAVLICSRILRVHATVSARPLAGLPGSEKA
jgi:hypothetical protein